METILYFQSRSRINAGEKLDGVRRIADKFHWHVQVVEGLPNGATVRRLMDFWKATGAIVECGGQDARINPAIFGFLPVVFLDHDPSCLPSNAFCVTHDSAETGAMAARELMRAGAKNFAFVPYPERRFWSEERERGFCEALLLNGFACSVFNGRRAKNNTVKYQKELRTFIAHLPKPCAVFAANDRVAGEVAVAAQYAGVEIPGELMLIGVDNALEICEKTVPSLSSIKPDFTRGGTMAALMLVAALRDKDGYRGSRRRTFGPLHVVSRASTRTFHAHDPVVLAVLDLIRREGCTGLTAEEALKLFPCARRQAEIRFRKATGRSVLEEIHAVRLERAKELLRRGDMPMKVIADFCGFENPNSLGKFFKAKTGKTMTNWRDSCTAIDG